MFVFKDPIGDNHMTFVRVLSKKQLRHKYPSTTLEVSVVYNVGLEMAALKSRKRLCVRATSMFSCLQLPCSPHLFSCYCTTYGIWNLIANSWTVFDVVNLSHKH